MTAGAVTDDTPVSPSPSALPPLSSLPLLFVADDAESKGEGGLK